MPLVAQAAGVQRHRVACVAQLGRGPPGRRHEPRLAVCGREPAVAVQARLAGAGAGGEWPLLRLLEQGVAQAGDVQVTPSGAVAMLVPHALGAVEGEQRLAIQAARRQPLLDQARHIHSDAPVVARLARCGQRSAHAADAPFAVGDGAALLAPARRRQQQVCKGHGGGVGVGLLHDDELGALQRAAHGGLVGHRLRRVGAGYPQRLDLAVGRGLEHFHCALARLRGHVGHAPQRGHLGAVNRIGQIAVRAQQVGQAADLAPAHGIGLAGQ